MEIPVGTMETDSILGVKIILLLTLMALRCMANFCIVSSLHDGMNLVAKEFIASRFDEKGVLILSPFTGSARELTDAAAGQSFCYRSFCRSY